MAGVHTAIRLLCDQPRSNDVLKRLCGMQGQLKTWKLTVGFPGSSGGSPGVASRRRKLFRFAHASSCVSSIVKCSSESRPVARAWARTAHREALPSPPHTVNQKRVAVVGLPAHARIMGAVLEVRMRSALAAASARTSFERRSWTTKRRGADRIRVQFLLAGRPIRSKWAPTVFLER